jgi:hypothetical protein
VNPRALDRHQAGHLHVRARIVELRARDLAVARIGGRDGADAVREVDTRQVEAQRLAGQSRGEAQQMGQGQVAERVAGSNGPVRDVVLGMVGQPEVSLLDQPQDDDGRDELGSRR